MELLKEMYENTYEYPKYCTNYVKRELVRLIEFFESGETRKTYIEEYIEEMVYELNDIQEIFWNGESDIDDFASKCILNEITNIIQKYRDDINIEQVLRHRRW
ncbi:DUF5713 family protein [Streptobacillus canis]|uniref:DUF5713 family protein n=1 Tax=Streptobacillus canis TaxID=2678686 RepID=UPI0012E1C80B|nr:DUF5713 family protein [Streptobacillus canis]